MSPPPPRPPWLPFAVAVAGATASSSGRDAERENERKRRRGARRTPQLDPSLQLQASAPPFPSQSHSQSPCVTGPEPPFHWSAAVPVREGGRGKRTTAGIRFPPQNQDRLSTLLLPLGSLPKAGANQTTVQTEPTFLLASWVFGTPLGGSLEKSKYLASSPGVALRASDVFCPGPSNWTDARSQNLGLSRTEKEGRQDSQELGVCRIPQLHPTLHLVDNPPSA